MKATRVVGSSMAEQQQQQQQRRRRCASSPSSEAGRQPTVQRAAPPAALLLLPLLLLLAGARADGLPDNSAADFPQSEAVRSTRPVVARQWRAHLSRVAALTTGGGGGRPARSVGELLGPVLTEWEYALPLPQVRRSLVYAGGANARLRRVVHDLLVGGGGGGSGNGGSGGSGGGGGGSGGGGEADTRPTIKISAIGGSITHGAKASRMGENDWFALVGAYARAAFPRARVLTRNGALPATPSALMNMCLETYVDDDVDLVFVEVR